MAIYTPFGEIDFNSLQRLVENKVQESRRLEYKQQIDLVSDKGKLRFLAGVSAFGNAEGGHMIIGIEEGRGEERGIPARVSGLDWEKGPNEVISDIQNLIRDAIEPNIHDLQIKSISTGSDKYVIVIDIPQSLSKPHRVNFGKHRDFYIRNSNGKHPADVEELRQMFTFAETVRERIRRFSESRIDRILENIAPNELHQNHPKLVLQVVPLGSSSTGQKANLPFFVDLVAPSFNSIRYNFDGIVLGGEKGSYIQVFWDGSIESVQDYVLSFSTGEEPEFVIPSDLFESSVRGLFLPRFLGWQKKLNVSPPSFIFLSLLNVDNFSIKLNEKEQSSARMMRTSMKFEPNKPFDRPFIFVPEVMTETLEPDIDALMKPVFDRIWQAAGYPRSLNYDKDGTWTGKIYHEQGFTYS